MAKTKYNTEPLRRERLRRGWTMTALALRLGVTPPVVSRIESGAVQSPRMIARMAAELGVEMARLVK